MSTLNKQTQKIVKKEWDDTYAELNGKMEFLRLGIQREYSGEPQIEKLGAMQAVLNDLDGLMARHFNYLNWRK